MEKKLVNDQQAASAQHQETLLELAVPQARLAALEQAARRFLQGYPSLAATIRAVPQAVAELFARGEGEIADALDAAEAAVGSLRDVPGAKFFRQLPLAAVMLIAMVAGAVLALSLGMDAVAWAVGGALALVLSLVAIVFYQHGKGKVRPFARLAAERLRDARVKCQASVRQANAARDATLEGLQVEFDQTIADLDAQRARADEVEAEFRRLAKEKLEAQPPRLLAQLDAALADRLARAEHAQTARRDAIEAHRVEEDQRIVQRGEAELGVFLTHEQGRWSALQADWHRAMTPLSEEVAQRNACASAQFPEWSPEFVESWSPPGVMAPAARLGRLDFRAPPDARPQEARFALPGGATFSLPLMLAFPQQGSLLFETEGTADARVIATMQNALLRLFASSPPGKVAMTIIDPLGLGQNFAGLMHLADYEESLINRRIWTQRDHIEERLAELNEHIEKVIQMYLRTEYATITEYNESAGSVAEKYHFLAIADFPESFSETAVKRLQSIALSGPRCGVFVLLHWNKRVPVPEGLAAEDLRRASVCLRSIADKVTLLGEKSGASLTLDAAPDVATAAALVHKVGRCSVDSNRVEVPFVQIAPQPSERWSSDTTHELRVALGRTGATKQQYLAIGKGTRQHALVAGKTGSGKSTLFHVIITNLALWASPDQVEFYLIDFKKGVEFKCYAAKRLPHARVVAIESDREFGLSVLQRVDDELRRRGDLFRKCGVQDLAGYKRSGAAEPMPRTLLLIDEFQEFYTDDDAIAQNASLLFDRIVRQGRAFGIHVILGSQTLGGAYTLARATLGQMVIRIALQCNEADSYLIMDESNAAPRLLTRPGEGIYNDDAGAIEGNSPFQVCWLSDEERDAALDEVRALADDRHDRHRAPIVFEGNAPADVRGNILLSRMLESPPMGAPTAPCLWLGAPNAIKGPTEAMFQRQSGNHLLIVGQRDEAALTMVGLSLIALAAQHPLGTVKLVLIHAGAAGSPDEAFLRTVAEAIPHGVTMATQHELAHTLEELASDLAARQVAETTRSAPSIFVFIHGLQRFKKLRHEDEFSFSTSESDGVSPATHLGSLITEGSSHGMHLVVTLDTYNNATRFLNRKALSEFEMRVVF
ncbi:MAG: FtsK/SpoIIIE domain-containing protein, partial [Roseimicrobium sp.]